MGYFVLSENNKAHTKVGLQSTFLYSISNNADGAGLFISSDDPLTSPVILLIRCMTLMCHFLYSWTKNAKSKLMMGH